MMSYAIDANGALKCTESNAARAVTSLSHMDHKDNDKARRATIHQGDAQDNKSPRWREEYQATGGGTSGEYIGIKMKEGGEERVHNRGTDNTPLGRGVHRVPNQASQIPLPSGQPPPNEK